MRSSQEFRTTVRRGVRSGSASLVVHADLADQRSPHSAETDSSTRVGFVVSKRVGNAVTRNRVKRRLRHMVAARLSFGGKLPRDLRIVVRALPPAALEPQRLASDFDAAWSASLSKVCRWAER